MGTTETVEKTFKKEKIYEDEFIYTQMKNSYARVINAVNGLSKEMGNMGLGVLTRDLLMDFKTKGVKVFIDIYQKQFDTALSKLPESLKKDAAAKYNHLIVLNKFQGYFNVLNTIDANLHSRTAQLVDYDLIIVKNSEASLSPKLDEVIKSKSSVFIETPTQAEIYKKGKVVENQINELLKIWDETGSDALDMIQMPGNLTPGLFEYDEENGFSFNPKLLWFFK